MTKIELDAGAAELTKMAKDAGYGWAISDYTARLVAWNVLNAAEIADKTKGRAMLRDNSDLHPGLIGK